MLGTLLANEEGVSALQSISPVDRPVRAEAPVGSIFSFVPAGSAENARKESRRAVRQLMAAIRDHVAAEGDGRTVLLADFSGAQMEPTSSVTCLDLADANPAEARQAISISEAVFVVSETDPASIEDACAQAAWLQYLQHSLRRTEACGLLLVPVSGGMSAAEAERRIGLPVCGVLRSASHIDQLARWITQE
jgi:hypothetical protein